MQQNRPNPSLLYVPLMPLVLTDTNSSKKFSADLSLIPPVLAMSSSFSPIYVLVNSPPSQLSNQEMLYVIEKIYSVVAVHAPTSSVCLLWPDVINKLSHFFNHLFLPTVDPFAEASGGQDSVEAPSRQTQAYLAFPFKNIVPYGLIHLHALPSYGSVQKERKDDNESVPNQDENQSTRESLEAPKDSSRDLIEDRDKNALLIELPIQLDPASSDHISDSSKRFSKIAVGGTFDRMHAGHRLLLTTAFRFLESDHIYAKRKIANPGHSDIHDAADTPDKGDDEPSLVHLVIGISGDELLQNKPYKDMIDSFEERVGNVLEFLKSSLGCRFAGAIGDGVQEQDPAFATFAPSSVAAASPSPLDDGSIRSCPVRIHIAKLAEPNGPAASDPDIEAIVVSEETQKGVAAINDTREKSGLSTLEVVTVKLLYSQIQSKADVTEDTRIKLSSTELRKQSQKMLLA